MPAPDQTVSTVIADVVDKYDADLIDVRRDLHAHPELSWCGARTSDVAVNRVEQAGWRVTRYSRTGFAADLGEGGPWSRCAPTWTRCRSQDLTDDPWASTVAGVAHACGHDVHTAALVGAALALAEVHDRGLLPGRVRLLFQPAEEVMPGGALHLIDEGALDEVERVFALHCDPSVDVGQVGLRVGPLTGAADRVEVRLAGTGGHTCRPHLTEDLTFALAKVITELPAVLSRRIDPRAGVSVVWGSLHAGSAPNVIPDHGLVAGTVRMLDAVAWADARRWSARWSARSSRPYGVTAEIDYQRACRRSSTSRVSNRILADAVEPVLGAGRARRRAAEPRRRGLRLVPRPGPRRDGAARHPHARRRRRTTCTRATCASTSARSASAPSCWPKPPLRALPADRLSK